jgi:hypothetical protein
VLWALTMTRQQCAEEVTRLRRELYLRRDKLKLIRVEEKEQVKAKPKTCKERLQQLKFMLMKERKNEC